MNRRDAFVVPSEPSEGKQLTLSHPISALKLIPKEDGTATVGSITRLGPDSNIELCGLGFNDQTVRIRVNGDVYFAFAADIFV